MAQFISCWNEAFEQNFEPSWIKNFDEARISRLLNIIQEHIMNPLSKIKNLI
jgi:hypothetical protein